MKTIEHLLIGSGVSIEFADSDFHAARNYALRTYGQNVYAADRARRAHFDSRSAELRAVAQGNPEVRLRMDAYRTPFDVSSERQDAFGGDAFHLARDLDFVHQQVSEEKHPVPNALSLFAVSNDVPVGARTHTIRRTQEQGEAMIYRAGQEVPRVSVTQAEESFPVRHLVTGFGLDIFETASSNFANSNLLARHMRAARRVIERKLNRIIWYGHKTAGLFGILDYPWLAKRTAGVAYDGTAAADDVIADLNSHANFPQENSMSTFAPDTMVTSPRVRNYLMNTPRSTTTDTTIGEFFTRNNAHISSIEEAWELQGVGPGGTDVVLFYKRDQESVAIEMVQPFTTLPTERKMFEDLVWAYLSYGGVNMRDVGNNIAVYVTPLANS